MPSRIWPMLAVMVAAWSLCAGGQSAPKVLLHIPFDGSADAAICAAGSRKTSHVHLTFQPGKRGRAAEIGSDRYPCGLAVRGQGIFDKRRGSFAVWYKPSWDPSDPEQLAATRTLVTDDRPPLGVGHFWITAAQKAVHFAWRGRTAEGVSAPIRNWEKDTWHHVVATWDNENGLALYLDGDLGGERKMRWQLPPADTLYIGANRRGLNRAEGLLDELYLYDRALTPAEVELACVQNLAAERAPAAKPLPRTPGPAKPTLTLHLPFDGSATAKTARGKGAPAVAKGMAFTNGLLGKALVCGQGIDLAYAFDKNVSKQAGAITFWARSSFGAAGQRGILLADEEPPAKAEAKPRNTLGVWVQRAGMPTLRFDMLPSALQRGLFRWNSAEWYHIGLCWRRGRDMALYVNGHLVSRRSGAGAVWPDSPSRLLRVGSWQGQMAAEAVIDDLRVYDAPLDAEHVRQEADRFLLPLVLQPRRTLLSRGRATELVIDACNISAKAFDGDLTVRIANPGGQEVAATTVKVQAKPKAKAEVRVSLSDKALAHDGLYRVTTASPNRVNTPVSYFIVVPELPASGAVAAPKPKLKLLETIDCAKLAGPPSRFCHSGRSTVKDAAGAKCREAGPLPNDRFAVRFTVQAPGEPHVAVVTYPDDGPRSAEIVINSKSFPNALDVATGYFTGDAPTGRLVELPIYFWPRERENAVIFRTLAPGRPAACATISVHQVLEGLAAARVEAPPDGGRPLGLWWRDPSVPLMFGARQVLAPDIYQTFRRLAEYARFTGQNLVCYPLAWDSGVLYPSAAEGFRQGAGADRHCADWVQYALHLCERRGVRFLPELFLGDLFALSDAFGSHTDDDVAAGIASARMVMWDGSLSEGGIQEPPRYSPAHPAVRKAILRLVDEIAGRYGGSAALEGISLHLGQSHCVWFGSLQCGYDDATIAQFEKDTGIRVPADKSGAARFSQRARWLLANKLQEWVGWRCRTVHALHAEAAARLTRRRADLKLCLTIAAPDSMAWNPLFSLSSTASGIRTLDELYREGGIDLRLYAKSPHIIIRRVLSPTDYRLALYQGGAPGAHPAAVRDHQLLSEAAAPFHPLERVGVVCAHRPFASSIGRARPLSGFWWQPPAFRASYPTPSGRAFLEPLARAVAELDAESLAIGGASLLTPGHEEDVRAFARAYRALPRRRFSDVSGMSDPVCARELRDGDRRYLYLVNRMAFPVEAWMAFAPASVALRDLAAGKKLKLAAAAGRALPAPMPKGFVSEHRLAAKPGPVPDKAETVPVTGALLHVTLAPFELRSYQVLDRDAKIVYAASKAPIQPRLRLAQRIESAKSLVENSKAPPDVIAAARRTLALADRAWRKREISRVEHLLNSYPIERLR